uniref:Sushi domain-containing protein n=1 Tax=Magallana gigas TaxID=29159 RepID=A0A8W8MHC4_MAGGI
MGCLDVTILVIAALVCRGEESQPLPAYPKGAFEEPEVFEPEDRFCPENGIATFVDSPPVDSLSCVPAPGPVQCSLQEMVSGRKPKGFICKNKGYLSGWTKVPQEGPFNVKCCSSTEYSYSENSCVTHIRTPDFPGTGLPSWYFPVGAIQLSNGTVGYSVRYCVFVRRTL